MKKFIDLHCHSSYSEGNCSVTELLDMAKANNAKVFALTDHNVIAGLPELLELAPKYNIKAIPGVELYTRFHNRGFHLLGYNFDINDPMLNKWIKSLQEDNEHNIQNSVEHLIKQGFKIDIEAIFNLPAKNYGAVHILQEIDKYPENLKKINKDLPPDQQGFFDKIEYYLGADKPAHFPLSELPTEEAIAIIKNSGGFTSLAHPGQQLINQFDNIIVDLAQHGLDAIEVLSPYHNWHQIEHYQYLALENNLLITGGSDYHGDIDFTKKELIARQGDYFRVPYNIYEQLKKNIPNL